MPGGSQPQEDVGSPGKASGAEVLEGGGASGANAQSSARGERSSRRHRNWVVMAVCTVTLLDLVAKAFPVLETPIDGCLIEYII